MLPKERVIAELNFQEVRPVPYAGLGYDPKVEDKLNHFYGSEEWKDRIDNQIKAISVTRNLAPPEGEKIVVDSLGSKWRRDRRPFHLVEPALKEPDLTGFEFPPVDTFFPEDWFEIGKKACQEKSDYFVVVGFGFGVFERSWALRGFEDALMDSISEPKFYRELLTRITEHQKEITERLLELPVDGIKFSDDWGNQRGVLLGPERWREFVKPCLAELYDLVHQAGKYTLSHCCGNVREIIPDLIEIGLDVLESVQPEAMDPYQLKEEYGQEIVFWGGLGSQSTIPFGTPSEIKKEVHRLCRVMGSGGGYILGPAKSLQPETPAENASAVIEAFLEQS